MAYTYNPATDIGMIRLNIGDTDVADNGARAIFSDEELQAILDRADGSVLLASARALLAIASSKALLAKRVSLDGFSKDTSVVARELRDQAKAFMDQVGQDPEFDYAEWGVTDFASREIIRNDALRSL